MTCGPERELNLGFNPGHTSSFPVPDLRFCCSVRTMALHGQGRDPHCQIPDLLAVRI